MRIILRGFQDNGHHLVAQRVNHPAAQHDHLAG